MTYIVGVVKNISRVMRAHHWFSPSKIILYKTLIIAISYIKPPNAKQRPYPKHSEGIIYLSASDPHNFARTKLAYSKYNLGSNIIWRMQMMHELFHAGVKWMSEQYK